MILQSGVEWAAAATDGNLVFIAGGRNAAPVATINIFDPTTWTMNSSFQLPVARAFLAAAFVPGFLIRLIKTIIY